MKKISLNRMGSVINTFDQTAVILDLGDDKDTLYYTPILHNNIELRYGDDILFDLNKNNTINNIEIIHRKSIFSALKLFFRYKKQDKNESKKLQ